MNIIDYMKNPTGKGGSIYPLDEMRKRYDSKYDAVKGDITHETYYQRNMLFYHVKVPSGSVEGLYYDIIICFKKNHTNEKFIDGMNFKIFSNCPSFVFTYAHAYSKAGLVFERAQYKISSKSLKEAKVRNKYNVVGFEYSLYLACKYIFDNKINTVEHVLLKGKRVVILKTFLDKIQDFDYIMKTHKIKSKAKRSADKDDKVEKKKKEDKNTRRENRSIEKTPTASKIRTAKTSNVVNRTSKTRTGKTNKVKTTKKK